MATGKKDYRSFDKFPTVLWTTLGIVAVLLSLSAIPPFRIDELEIRRTNMLSPFVHISDDESVITSSSEWIEDGQIYRSYSESEISPIPDDVSSVLQESELSPSSVMVSDELGAERFDEWEPDTGTPAGAGIEEYGESGLRMDRFLRNLLSDSGNRNIRIAFLGDSFIEGDILTSSLRSELQKEYGGEGVGFVPFADPIAKYRGTVKQEYSGWSCYNLLNKKGAPERNQNDFFMSGYVSVPQEGACATFRSGSYNGRVLTSTRARILFKNRGEGEMEVIVNNRDTLHYQLACSDEVQCIDVTDARIEELSVILPVCDDFVGYGIVFEGDCGVNIDNYGLRSHRGTNLLATAYDVNSQIGGFLEYDLIVMEYGLNAMQKTVTQYGSYQDRMKKTVDYIRKSFPNSAIMILSVGDVGMKVDGRIVTAPAVPAMVAGQRTVARQCQVSFWNMYQEMGGSGSMKHFVDKGWANKDYLHINSKGGEQLARLLMNSLLKKKKDDEPVKINI